MTGWIYFAVYQSDDSFRRIEGARLMTSLTCPSTFLGLLIQKPFSGFF
jgi:hypothetical protein